MVAVVLAAGQSRRFGGDKLVAPLDGKPLCLHIADRLAALPLAGRLAICPAGTGQRSALFRSRGFDIIANSDPARGLASSLALGARVALEQGAEAMLVCLADMPYVPEQHLLSLIAATTPSGMAASRMARGGGPPAVFSRTSIPALMHLTGDQGARALLRSAVLLDAPQGVLKDFDLPSDFE